VSDDAWKTNTLPAPAPDGERGSFYLLVVQGESSSMFRLPSTGIVTIGRGADSDLPLDDGAASRSHARLVTSDGTAVLHDLESHNGTFVNGDRIEGARELASGDVVSIGEVTLILHADRGRRAQRSVLDAQSLRERLAAEVERSNRYERPLTVAVLGLASATAREEIVERLAPRLRLMDVIAQPSEAQVVVVMPERDDALEGIRGLLEAIPDARAGVASWPHDASDADTLLASARAASALARPGAVVAASEAAREIRLGERSILVADTAMVRLFDLITRLAASDLPILVLGETGSGKEGAALAVHHLSARAAQPFITLNCAAIPESLVESELFGYERGAFTGATAAKPGKLEAASGGTLFLDEIGELPPPVQAKLLRALETKRLTRLGDMQEREVDLRIVAATNRKLDEDVKSGRFRQDLYFRLGVATVVLPPLRDRPREIPILARRFLADVSARAGREAPPIAPATLLRLCAYGWPGNVRELRNAIEYAAATVQDDTIEPWHLPESIIGAAAESDLPAPADGRFRPLADELRDIERRRMIEALDAAGGVQRHAAALIGMPVRTFTFKLKQYAITPRKT
jgi:two-component system, NtrC family, response regulator AtoC